MSSAPRSPSRTEGNSIVVQLLAQILIVSALLLGATACFRANSVSLEFTRPIDLNPRVRLDRKPLTQDQAFGPEYSGPYRDGIDEIECKRDSNGIGGGCEVMSPITPKNIQSPQLEKLLQSNCLWIGEDVDFVGVSWEMVAHVRREPMHLTCGSPTDLGLCRLQDPLTSRPIEFQDFNKDFAGCSEPEPPVSETMELSFGSSPSTLPLSDTGGPLIIDTDLHLATTPLVAEYVSRATPDPYRTCPGSADAPVPISGGTPAAAALYGGVGCSAGNTAVDACARDCMTIPPTGGGDRSLRLRDTTTNATRWLRPNLMPIGKANTVGNHTIARSMSPVANDATLRRWQIEVSQIPGTQRWHENFSPNLMINSVRVFVPGPNPAMATDDTTPALDPTMQQLVLRGTYKTDLGNANPFVIECTGSGDSTSHGWTYLPTAGNCTGTQMNDLLQGVTPGYLHQELNLAGLPLSEPLQWDVRLANGNSAPVMIEFTMVAVGGGLAFLGDPSVINLGALVIGHKADGFVTFENVGDVPVRVTGATLGGANPGDFGFRLLADRVPVPLPLSIAMTPHKRVIKQLEGYGAIPFDYAATATVGPKHTHLVRSNRDGQTLNVFNNQITYDGSVAIYRDAPRPVPYQFPAGTVPLTTLDAYTEAHLPLTLDPGRVLRVMVKAQPSAYGVRRAELKLDAYAAIGGQARSAIVVLLADGKIGGDPHLWPSYAAITGLGRAGGDRLLLLTNDGDRDVKRGRIRFASGSNFSLGPGNTTQQILAPGTSEVITVHVVPICPNSGIPPIVTDRVFVETDTGIVQADLAGFADCTH